MLSRDCTPVDSLWGLGMGVVAVSTFLQSGGGTPRRVVLTAICVVWALRLGGYMLWRWRDHGPDRRYVRLLDKAKAERGWSYGYAAFRLVFMLQMPLRWLVYLPVQLGQVADEPAMLGTRVGAEPPSIAHLKALERGLFLSGLAALPVIRDADVLFLALHGGPGEDGTESPAALVRKDGAIVGIVSRYDLLQRMIGTR